MYVESLSIDEQVNLYSKMGSAFNDYIWRESNSQNHSNLSILDLKKVSKFDMWSKMDKRIAAFFTSMTENKYKQKYGASIMFCFTVFFWYCRESVACLCLTVNCF